MTDREKEARSERNGACLLIAFAVLLIGGAAFVGVVKFVAWWNIAQGCKP